MTTLSSRRRSPCWRSILRPYELRDYPGDLVAVRGRFTRGGSMSLDLSLLATIYHPYRW